MTSSGASENAQKNARAAPVVDALSARQYCAAQAMTLAVLLRKDFFISRNRVTTSTVANPL
jgi:hypothetical protein